MKLPSIQGIPLEYIQSILKIDSTSSTSTSGLIWLPRECGRFNLYYANKMAGYKHTNKKKGYQRWVVSISHNAKKYDLRCSRIVFLLHNKYLTEGKDIDHADGNSLNNNVDNLREGTKCQNNQNSKIPKNNTSGHKDVFWDKNSRKWRVQISAFGKSYYFGLYVNKEDAVKVSIEARKKIHGEFGRDK